MSFGKKKKQQRPKPKPVAHAKVVPKEEPKSISLSEEQKTIEEIDSQIGKGIKNGLNSKNEIPKNPAEKKLENKWKEQDAKKEFLRVFGRLTIHHRAWDVWRDFVVMAACSLSNPVDKSHYDEREKRYLSIIKKYNKEEQKLFPELFAQTVLALENNPEQDFLGDIFTQLNLGDKHNSQFFTPYHVCDLMAKITVNDISKEIDEKGYVTIHDPCCGAGATLIAGVHEVRRQLEKKNLNYQNHVLIVAQDIDEVVALMCYIQLSLLGVAAYIKVGNIFTEPITDGDSTENYWFTMMYFSDIWRTRRMIHKMTDILKGEKE